MEGIDILIKNESTITDLGVLTYWKWFRTAKTAKNGHHTCGMSQQRRLNVITDSQHVVEFGC